MATCYGFIDKGQMLEEISAAALHEKCRACLELTVDDTAKASATLERELGTDQFEVLPGNVLRLHAFMSEPQTVVVALTRAGVALTGMENKGADLEDYFLTLIGGEHHA